MPTTLTPIRIARARRTSFSNSEETQELDFDLGLNMGIAIYNIHFGIREAITTPTSAPLHGQVFMSVHVETGGLEGAIDAFPTDDFILDSEIIAQVVLQIASGDTAQIEGALSQQWLTPINFDYLAMTGEPLILAQNVTFRGVTSESTLNVNGGQVTIMYKYVKLTDQELGRLFAVRR